MPALPHEKTYVETPFVEQLKQMGWSHIEGDIDVPYLTERKSFRDVLLTGRLRAALKTINIDDASNPWLDDDRIDQVVGRLERISAPKLMEANREALDLIVGGVEVAGEKGAFKDRDRTASVIDFEHPERNDFLAVSQFRVEVPGGRHFIVPDIVLFVNGIPLVVVECKSPKLTHPIEEGINQLLRYSNQRPEVEEDEGCERLFYYNQFVISTFRKKARAATVGAGYEQYMEWKDTSPVPMSKVAESLGKKRLNSQETLVDEAHRSHTSMLHANMMRALPNCVKIGLTGTPIIAGRSKKRTHEIFGDYIDQYTIEQSQKDGATVKILYEGRKAEAAVEDGRTLDQFFDDMFRSRTEEEREAIRRRHGNVLNILEAKDLIQVKAEDMLLHYAANIMPNGFKAQVVAVSRRAAIRYCEAFKKARQKLAKKKALNREQPQREFVNGQGFLYLGKSYRLKLIDNDELQSGKTENRKALRLWQGYFEMLESEKSRGREHFVSWYKGQLQKQLKARIPRYDKRIGVDVKQFRILDLDHRWASCGRNGVISFNWRSIMAPIWVFDYILVHEMVHKIERRHSKQFWRLVSRVMPDYEEHARWLNENGANLDL